LTRSRASDPALGWVLVVALVAATALVLGL
jgi:hypothetical protein